MSIAKKNHILFVIDFPNPGLGNERKELEMPPKGLADEILPICTSPNFFTICVQECSGNGTQFHSSRNFKVGGITIDG